MSTAGVASQSLSAVRSLTSDAIATFDRAVQGSFDLAAYVVKSDFLTDLADKSISTMRDTWSTGVSAAQRLLIEV
jgi:hypothetical protein